jgi:RNA-directed DNA polymerase
MISSPLPDLDALDREALKALVMAQHSELLGHRSHAQEIDRLKLIIEKYRRMIFGRKSEKLTGQLEQLEFRLEELETAQATCVLFLLRIQRGWKAYFGFCETPSVLGVLDQWLRRRLRAVIWKQWKRGTMRFRKLCAHGISRDLAAQTAGSPLGPWHIANSPAMSFALPRAYFDSLGLPRLFIAT